MNKQASQNPAWEKSFKNASEFFQLKINHVYLLYSTKHSQRNFLDIFQPTLIKQIHSDIIIDIDADMNRIGDGLMSQKKNVVLGIKIADCLPVYLFNKETLCIIHCGWRGIIQGIVKKAKELLGTYSYALGACIGPCCYEVQEDVQKLFIQQYQGAVIQRDNRWYLDLKAAVKKDLGIGKMLASLDFCTKCNPAYFYSHRRGDIHKRNFAVCMRK